MIPINIFKNIKTTKELEQLSDTLHISDQSLYEEYLVEPIVYYGQKAFPYYGCDPYQIESEGNYRYKFIEIGFHDQDKIGLFFKTYNMYGKVGGYLWIKPFSSNGIKLHEELVFDHLYSNNLLESILIPEDLPNIDYSKLHKRLDEYFCNVCDRYNEISKSKWRSKKGINRLKNEYNIKMQVNDYDPDQIQALRHYWWKLHGKQDVKFDKTIDFLLNLQGKVIVLTWVTHDCTIGFTIISDYFPRNKCGRIIQNVNILKTEIDVFDDFLRAHLADLMHYDTINYMKEHNYNYAYIGDAYGSAKYLTEYKARNFKLHTYHYDLPISEYNRILNK